MRPFKFFFALSLGLFIFFFLAKFIVMALIVALGLTMLFAIIKRIRNFIMEEKWKNHYDEYESPFSFPNRLAAWDPPSEVLHVKQERDFEYLQDFRKIKIQ